MWNVVLTKDVIKFLEKQNNKTSSNIKEKLKLLAKSFPDINNFDIRYLTRI